MNKQLAYDIQMIKDYQYIQTGLKSNKNKVKKIVKYINNLTNESDYEIIKPIVEDVIYLIQSLDYLNTSCNSLCGNRNKFFPYTRFYREYISTIRIVIENIENIFGINSSINLINLMETEINWRHRLEHGKDPFYDGDIYKIISMLNVNKMVKFIEEICSILCTRSNLSGHPIPNITIDYGEVSIVDRKSIIQNLYEINFKIFEKITEMSYMAMDGVLNDEERNIIDIGFKYQELDKCLYYIYINDKRILKDYSGLMCDDFSYFTRMAVTITYQICDKLGVYLDNKHNLNLGTKYFKRVVKEVNNCNLHDSITNVVCNIRNTYEYRELNKIRQSIAHGKKSIDFQANADTLSSLIVKTVEKFQIIINAILDDYFYINNYKVSERAQIELKRKSTYKRL
ncbi:hypothetical protein [Clostridium botulinum]|uniref:hypothetical protein n=1 Tax=Clostridium botulinum TaxID=1491 RepID=UPI0004D437C7|nr:hypothetical protein [Clostridium botulinum]KEI03003.1 hypothetical protein Z952_08900 [Clostridium botulinum C/D str. BKT75002]KEI07387.1 hypothetical protein Z954_04420 [Clostridium botulinum C/D str. BKT2873]QPW59763.1 hypothetical protein IG390_08420 [Clostridium botulinum]QPW62288.1 hypothetical protein IG390_15045 [Clostridium phage CWou-2020b]